MSILAIIAGLVLLIWGANRFVASASEIARLFNISPLLIGMIIIGFGTSAPELLMSSLAAWQGASDLALANVLGSNIINIGLILGLTAIICPITVQSGIVRKEIPFLCFCGCLVGWQLFDLNITRLDAFVLLGVFAVFLWYSIYQSARYQEDSLCADVENRVPETRSSKFSLWFFLLASLAGLLIGSRLLVWGAIHIATLLGVSELIIGLTIVALGTSLPELTTSVIAALRKEPDLAIGNVLGSNIFNLLVVVGAAAMVSPMSSVAPQFLYREWPAMMLLPLLLVAVCFKKNGDGRISRLEGAILVVAVLAYNVYILLA